MKRLSGLQLLSLIEQKNKPKIFESFQVKSARKYLKNYLGDDFLSDSRAIFEVMCILGVNEIFGSCLNSPKLRVISIVKPFTVKSFVYLYRSDDKTHFLEVFCETIFSDGNEDNAEYVGVQCLLYLRENGLLSEDNLAWLQMRPNKLNAVIGLGILAENHLLAMRGWLSVTLMPAQVADILVRLNTSRLLESHRNLSLLEGKLRSLSEKPEKISRLLIMFEFFRRGKGEVISQNDFDFLLASENEVWLENNFLYMLVQLVTLKLHHFKLTPIFEEGLKTILAAPISEEVRNTQLANIRQVILKLPQNESELIEKIVDMIFLPEYAAFLNNPEINQRLHDIQAFFNEFSAEFFTENVMKGILRLCQESNLDDFYRKWNNLFFLCECMEWRPRLIQRIWDNASHEILMNESRLCDWMGYVPEEQRTENFWLEVLSCSIYEHPIQALEEFFSQFLPQRTEEELNQRITQILNTIPARLSLEAKKRFLADFSILADDQFILKVKDEQDSSNWIYQDLEEWYQSSWDTVSQKIEEEIMSEFRAERIGIDNYWQRINSEIHISRIFLEKNKQMLAYAEKKYERMIKIEKMDDFDLLRSFIEEAMKEEQIFRSLKSCRINYSGDIFTPAKLDSIAVFCDILKNEDRRIACYNAIRWLENNSDILSPGKFGLAFRVAFYQEDEIAEKKPFDCHHLKDLSTCLALYAKEHFEPIFKGNYLKSYII